MANALDKLRAALGFSLEGVLPRVEDVVQKAVEGAVTRSKTVGDLMTGVSDSNAGWIADLFELALGLVPAGPKGSTTNRIMDAVARGTRGGIIGAKKAGANPQVVAAAERDLEGRMKNLARNVLDKAQAERFEALLQIADERRRQEREIELLNDKIKKLEKARGVMTDEQWNEVKKFLASAKQSVEGMARTVGSGVGTGGRGLGNGIARAAVVTREGLTDAAHAVRRATAFDDEDRQVWHDAHAAGREWRNAARPTDRGAALATWLGKRNPNDEPIPPYRLLGGTPRRHPVEFVIWGALGLVGVLIGVTVYYNSF